MYFLQSRLLYAPLGAFVNRKHAALYRLKNMQILYFLKNIFFKLYGAILRNHVLPVQGNYDTDPYKEICSRAIEVDLLMVL